MGPIGKTFGSSWAFDARLQGQHRALRLTGSCPMEQDLDQVVRTDGRSRQRLGRPREVRDALDEHDLQPQAAGLGSGLL